MKLGKKVLTHKCISAPTPATEKELELLVSPHTHTVCLPQYDQNRLPPQSYNFLYWIKTVETLDLTDIKSTQNCISKYSHKPLYLLDNTSQSNNQHTVN